MSFDEAAFVSEIETRAKQKWEESQEPLLLSQLGPELVAKQFPYKEHIRPLTLKQFVEINMKDHVSIVVHPNIKQKVGVIPSGKNYVYESSSSDVSKKDSVKSGDISRIVEMLRYDGSRDGGPTLEQRSFPAAGQAAAWGSFLSGGSSRRFVYDEKNISFDKVKAFLSLLDGLTFREIDGISIPLRTLVRMLVK